MKHPTIYDLIKAERERKQYVPGELARLAGLGRTNYERMEKGELDCRWSTIMKVCKVLGIDTLSVKGEK